ncbi:MAG: DUF305 domain-containing protein [Cytophagaceae bacterium]|nr:DUF305 domain-containing protein [Cytophagaceae bacterium]
MQTSHTQHAQSTQHQQHYGKLLIMGVLSFISMYILMYSMVNTFANVIPNVNQFYMAGLMTMPMMIIEVVVMSAMYMDKRRNALIAAASVVALIGFFLLIRQQGAIGDKQFLKSMIPHHAGAILMAEQANLKDPEIRKLSEKIISDQQAEIKLMKAKLDQLDE